MMLPTGRFAVIYADPPWQFRSWSDKGRNRCPDALVRQKGLAERHYKVISIEDIKALPVRGLALPDAALFLWVVSLNLGSPRRLSTGVRQFRPNSAGSTLGEAPGGVWQDRGAVREVDERILRLA